MQPASAAYHNNLGSAYRAQRKLEEAAACFRRAIQLKPDYADAHYNLGTVCSELGEHQDAAACFERAIALAPGDGESHHHLGSAWLDLGKPEEAIACYRRALQLAPDLTECHYSLGNAFQDLWQPREAMACYERAVRLKPDFAEAHNNLGNLLWRQWRINEAIACYRRALAHAQYERQHSAPLRATWRPHDNVRDPDRPLRLGFVSPDLGMHPAGCFLIRAIESLDRRQCHVVCYSDRIVRDPITHRFEAAAGTWRDAFVLSHEQLSEQIRSDRIDILFDLAGHTAGNRLSVFARKPAPIQVTWIGYEGTTGLGAIDYLLADRHLVPPGAERYYAERILRMPDGYICFDPPRDAPPVGPLPALRAGLVTWASFHKPAKITPAVVAVWARILRRLPRSRLMLRYHGLGSGPARARLTELFAAEGISSDRLEIGGGTSFDEYLAWYGGVDIMLDPFPYNGGLTTCEALWMGVPVITCPGETFASRHSLSHLSTVGLTETIARDLDEYVELAVKLAGDLPRLAEIRVGLRERVARSPLCDGKQFAENLIQLLRDVWRQWCRSR